MTLDFLVLYTDDLDTTVAFYRDQLGVEPRREQHGPGPVHYAFELDNVVLEVYPGRKKVRLGLAGVRTEVVYDPDGRTLVGGHPISRPD